MRRRGRIDRNQAEIVSALERMGCSVQSLARQGSGCPDLLIGYRGRNVLLEVKAPKGKPTSDQMTWGATWRGQLAIVRSVDDAIRAVSYDPQSQRICR